MLTPSFRLLQLFPLILLVFVHALILTPSSYAQLSQNSGINSNDSWITFDLATQTTVSSSNIAPPTITQTHHVEIGYDSNGKIVVNLWPTGASALATDSGQVSVIRLSGGNVTVFDQNGVLIPWVPPTSNVPAFNPLSLLGSNPGSSILSQLVVSNVSTQATTTNSQLSYSGSEAMLSRSYQSGQSSRNTQWSYAQSGSVWVANQVTLSLTRSNLSATRTLQFSNVHWSDNSANDTARANQGSTATNPPPTNTSTPASLSGSSSSNCPPYQTNQGGTQNVVFQHGFFSSGCTWWRMEPWLNQYFRWGIELTPSLNSVDNLTNQGNALVSDINSAGGNNNILIGHSQGGLIARYAAQYYQSINSPTTAGVVTLYTPHQGVPLAALAQGEIQNVLLGDMVAVWDDVGCGTPDDNLLCYLVSLQYSGISAQLINIGSLTDLVPGSAFLTNLNSNSENFQRAAVIGNTDRRWIEVRITDDFIFRGCNPEDSCGERNVAFIYGIIYDVVQVSWDIAEFDCLLNQDPYACAVADYLLPIWVDMDIADLDYNVLAAGGNPEDGFVPTSSQNYPSSSAKQYPIAHADSHAGATRSDRARNALEQALAASPFNVPTQAICGFSVSPANYSISGNGGSSTIALSTGAGCQWSAVSQTPWITITSGASGTSSGNIGLSVALNPQSVPRVGTVQVGNGTSSASFTVDQAGLCTYSLSDSSGTLESDELGDWVDTYSSSGGTNTITVHTNAGCVWSAASNASWLTIPSGVSGTGTGSFPYVAAPNSGIAPLTGTITVMDHTITVVVGTSNAGVGSFTISGQEQYLTYETADTCWDDTMSESCPQYFYGWDYGTVLLSVGNLTVTYDYGQSDTPGTIAFGLASALNGASSAPVTATAYSDGTVVLSAKQTGANTNYSFNVSVTDSNLPSEYCGYQCSEPYSGPSFASTQSASTLTGGS
jgi:pimeloyl-ACP methyl ester carboxylesterase